MSLLSNDVKLSSLSQKELFVPEDILAAGVDSLVSTNPYTGESGPARKGTVAATLDNIALLNTLLSKSNLFENRPKIDKICQSILTLLPSLRVIGVFDLFTPQEWLSDDNQPGRILVIILYLKQYPREVTSTIKKHLIQIQNRNRIKILTEAVASIL